MNTPGLIPAGTNTKPGFASIAKRWILERIFAWLGRYRRLGKDDEVKPKTNEASINRR